MTVRRSRGEGVPMLDGLGEFCTAALAAHECPSASVAVVRDGTVVLAAAYGLADVAAGRPATPDTRYVLASITKPITATAACVLADRGLIDLDVPLPAGSVTAPPGADWPAPTPRQLLQHRGGLTSHYDFRYGDDPRPPIDVSGYTRLYRRPGSGYEYANHGYGLLGGVLESASGLPLSHLLTREVFDPLGLRSSGLGTPGGSAATRYSIDGRGYPTELTTSHPGATTGFATASELALFGHRYDTLLRPATAAATRDAAPISDHLGYGLGWCVSRGDGPLILSHGGGMGGVATMLVVVPELALSVAVLTNGTSKAARNAIVDHVLSAAVPGYRPAAISPASTAPARSLAPTVGGWSGSITTPDGPVPVALQVHPDGRCELTLAGERATATATPSGEADLTVTVDLQLPTADARRNSPLLGLVLTAGADGLSGVARAYQDGDRRGWLGNLLSHPVHLTHR
ncbi:serine hydrolase domain-containing protein [Actinocatenispora sera]|uniref:serine hydrolase domain-containing protein n=1 Tax=Actinocatenispora sera TaxID=390989 RepID=UPI00340BB229